MRLLINRRLFLVAVFFGCLLVVGTGVALAASASIRNYGPFQTANDPDSGTCGNNWANDDFQRTFTLNTDNPYAVTENFGGTFLTVAGISPGACENGPNNGDTVGANVSGTFHGFEKLTIIGGTYNPSAQCTQSTCNTTQGFVNTVYGPDATYNVDSFKFNYASSHNGRNGTWQNADAANGGNVGDITGNP